MRLLSFSDIHTNLTCVRKLRAQERNDFDAIIVAGDIGGEIAASFFALLESFQCPVLYVYGNWDNDLGYDSRFGMHCIHLHNEIARVGQFYVAGFSGCPTHWGLNPTARQLYAETNANYASLLAKYKETKEEQEMRCDLINKEIDAELEIVAAKARDKRRKSYRNKIARLEDRRTRLIDKMENPLERIHSSKPYQAYRTDLHTAWAKALSENRATLVRRIKEQGIDPTHVVVTTHERLYRLDDDFGRVHAHLFGHRHGFKHTVFKGTHCVNVSVLDRVLSAVPNDAREEYPDEIWRNINAGTYTILETNVEGDMTVTSKQLDIYAGKWNVKKINFYGLPWAPEEASFALEGNAVQLVEPIQRIGI